MNGRQRVRMVQVGMWIVAASQVVGVVLYPRSWVWWLALVMWTGNAVFATWQPRRHLDRTIGWDPPERLR